MTDSPELPVKWMMLVAALQGIVLLYLKNAFESGFWPSESPLWSFPLTTLAVAVPVLLLLALERRNFARLAMPLGVFVLLLAVVAAYTGYQATPYGEFPLSSLVFVFGVSTAIACFKALMYSQQRASGAPMDYSVLFIYSWRNFLTLGLALLMTAVFFAILQLWGELFETISISFFKELFRMDWFMVPILAMAHGSGIIIFRNLQHVTDGITRLLQGLIKLLLPLVLAIAVIFVVTLTLVGLDALWSTGRGTALLMGLLAIVLFFVNAVYQDGRDEQPYPVMLHRALYIGLCVTPVLAALSFYGLFLRVVQYGWTVERCWAFVIWMVLTFFSVGYFVGVLRRRDNWTMELARVNVGMGVVVLVLLLLANSPVLDFRKISATSQLERVVSGKVRLENFDFWYAHTELARPGHLALETMKALVDDEDPALLDRIENPRWSAARGPHVSDNFWTEITYRPDKFDVPVGLKYAISQQSAPGEDVQSVLIRVDINADGVYEYLLTTMQQHALGITTMYYQAGKDWRETYMYPIIQGKNPADDVLHGDIRLRESVIKDLALGDLVLRVAEPMVFGGETTGTDDDK